MGESCRIRHQLYTLPAKALRATTPEHRSRSLKMATTPMRALLALIREKPASAFSRASSCPRSCVTPPFARRRQARAGPGARLMLAGFDNQGASPGPPDANKL